MPRHFLSVMTLLIGVSSGCSSYSAVSDYERHKQLRQSFESTVASAGGKVELKDYAIAGVKASAWNLTLANSSVPDDVITLMAGTSRLAEANFSKSSITDAQLLKMDELKLLQFTMNLDLSNTAISDGSFASLKNMRAVKKIILKGSKVTKAGADAFRKAYLASPDTIAIFKKPVIEL